MSASAADVELTPRDTAVTLAVLLTPSPREHDENSSPPRRGRDRRRGVARPRSGSRRAALLRECPPRRLHAAGRGPRRRRLRRGPRGRGRHRPPLHADVRGGARRRPLPLELGRGHLLRSGRRRRRERRLRYRGDADRRDREAAPPRGGARAVCPRRRRRVPGRDDGERDRRRHERVGQRQGQRVRLPPRRRCRRSTSRRRRASGSSSGTSSRTRSSPTSRISRSGSTVCRSRAARPSGSSLRRGRSPVVHRRGPGRQPCFTAGTAAPS